MAATQASTRARGCLVSAIKASAGMAAVAGFVMVILGLETPLVAATFGLALVIAGFILASSGWRYLANKDRKDSSQAATQSAGSGDSAPRTQLSPSMTAATALAIQIQGVVLGLVFVFSRQDTITVKVGAVSLGLGVIVGLLLYALAAIDVSGPRTQAAALFLFNFTLWTLAYGLLCIVAAFVAQHP